MMVTVAQTVRLVTGPGQPQTLLAAIQRMPVADACQKLLSLSQAMTRAGLSFQTVTVCVEILALTAAGAGPQTTSKHVDQVQPCASVQTISTMIMFSLPPRMLND
jgi:hypothetical protein